MINNESKRLSSVLLLGSLIIIVKNRKTEMMLYVGRLGPCETKKIAKPSKRILNYFETSDYVNYRLNLTFDIIHPTGQKETTYLTFK